MLLGLKRPDKDDFGSEERSIIYPLPTIWFLSVDLQTTVMLMTPSDLSVLMDASARKTGTDPKAAKKCVAVPDMKPSRPRSRNGASANFIGVVMLNAKLAKKMSNLPCVNKTNNTFLFFPF